jgi:DNA-binding protein HU-beta
LTKQELIDRVASDTGLQKRDAGNAVESVFKTITSTLQSGGDVSLTGFGKFHVAERGPRQGVNPQTRERITIPGGRVPRFTAGSALKQAVKGGGF